MTIAVSLKVNDGVVLAADSASTIMQQGAGGGAVINVYNNANKVFNLRKGLPIGMITWGLGGIGGASISTLAKDLRARLTDENWALDPQSYTIHDVATRVREFMYDEQYSPAAQGQQGFPDLGFIVAGYSAGAAHAEELHMLLTPGGCQGPLPLRQAEQTGVTWAGQPESISRLINGYSAALPGLLANELGKTPQEAEQIMAKVAPQLGAPVVNPAMPFQDAIDLAEFLVSVAINYSRFMPGAQGVGGPIEVAAVSKHEGFKWVRRKHYFDSELNPKE